MYVYTQDSEVIYMYFRQISAMLLLLLSTCIGAAVATSSEGTNGEMAVGEPQREGEEEEGRREGEGENRGEEMESQSADVSVLEATGEELTTPMEEGPSSVGTVQGGSGVATSVVPPLLTPHVQEQSQQETAASPVPSPGQ